MSIVNFESRLIILAFKFLLNLNDFFCRDRLKAFTTLVVGAQCSVLKGICRCCQSCFVASAMSKRKSGQGAGGKAKAAKPEPISSRCEHIGKVTTWFLNWRKLPQSFWIHWGFLFPMKLVENHNLLEVRFSFAKAAGCRRASWRSRQVSGEKVQDTGRLSKSITACLAFIFGCNVVLLKSKVSVRNFWKQFFAESNGLKNFV